MAAGKFDDAFSQGDVMRRLHALERKADLAASGRHLEAASVGRGGLRIQGGRLTIQDIAGDDMFRAGGDPGELFLRQDLLTPFALAIFADRIQAETQPGQVTAIDVSPFQDLGGPEISADIGPSGVALVLISASVSGAEVSSGPGAVANVGGRMSFEVTGATSQPPASDRSVAMSNQVSVGGAVASIAMAQRQGTSVVVRDLNPGVNTFRLLYARLFPGGTCNFIDRTIIIIGF